NPRREHSWGPERSRATMSMRLQLLAFVLLSLALALVGGGCSTTTIKPESELRPGHYQAIVIGDTGTGKFPAEFRSSFVERLKESGAVAQILDPAPDPSPHSAMIFSGNLDGDYGGHALWAEAPALAGGRFFVRDKKGTVLAKFTAVRESGRRLDDTGMAGLFRE